jgi:hypothetical protein
MVVTTAAAGSGLTMASAITRSRSGWFPVARTDIEGMLRWYGFARGDQHDFQGKPSYFYNRGRNNG